MPGVGFETFVPKRPDTKFVIKNITAGTPQEKIIHLFQYPIYPGRQRDLLKIPVVSEADIRHSLLKGELRTKGECGEICIVSSNIDLLQFDNIQKAFIESLACIPGALDGLEVTTATAVLNFAFKQNVPLVATADPKVWIVPAPDKFINGSLGPNEFRIQVRHNGRGLIQGVDYIISESGGAGTGFDTITFIAFAPTSKSDVIADYVCEI